MRVDDIFRGIGRFSVKFRWPIVAFWIVATVVLSAALPSLASATQGNNSAFLPASAPSEQALALAGPLGTSGNQRPVPVIVARTTGPLTAADQAWISGPLTTGLGSVASVVKVKELAQSPLSSAVTGQATQVQVLTSFQGGGDAQAVTRVIDNLRAAISKAGPPPGLQVHLTGDLAVQVDQQKQSGSTGNAVQGVTLIVIIVLLMIFYRAILASLLTVIPAFLTVGITGPLVGEAAQHGLKVSFLVQILLIVLVLGAGTDYGLFLVFRIREHMRMGETSKEAVVNALTKVGESITFSALTVIAALLSLLAATFEIYSNLGIPLAIGIAVMLLAGLTLTPALFAIFGKAAFWPSRYRAGEAKTGVWGAIATRIVRRPAVALSIGVVVFGALAAFVTGYVGGGFGGSISAPAGSDSAAGTALMSKYFPSTAANPTQLIYKLQKPVWEDPAPLVAAERQLKASGLFTGVTGPLNPVGDAQALAPAQYSQLHSAIAAAVPPGTQLPPAEPAALAAAIPAPSYQAYRASTQFVSADGTTIQFMAGLSAGDPSTTVAMNTTPAVRAEVARVAPTLQATANGVYGEGPAFYDVSTISNNDLGTVIPIAIVVIGILLALVMRSLVAPLYLIASVAVSYFASLGAAVLIFLKLEHHSGITFILPFLLFIFLLALGEDYNILVMTRIREEARKMPLRQAVSRAIGVTGTTVTSAGVVLAATFAVFAVVGSKGAGGDQIRDMGIGLTLGILMDTFVVRTILVPCTCVLLGRWNWWPSKLRVDSTEADAVGASADSLGLAGTAEGSRGDAGTDGAGPRAAGEVSPSVAPDGKHSLD